MGGKKTKPPVLAMPPLLRKTISCYMSAKALYEPGKLAETLGAMAGAADIRAAYAALALSGLVTLLLAFLTSLESVYLVNYSSDLVSEFSGIPQPRLELDSLVPVVAYQALLYLPFSIAIAVAHEALAFLIMKATGGKGSFSGQLYMAAVIALAISFSGVLSLFIPLPCLQVVAGFGILAINLYFLLYVSARAYSAVHGISVMHSLGVILLLVIPRFAILAFFTNWLAVLLGLSPPINMPEGI